MSNNNLSHWLIKMVMAGLLTVAALPAAAQAQHADASRGLWMAASSNEASLPGRTWGRLTMADGVLEFQSSNYEWRLALSEIKRIDSSKDLSNAFEVESVTGQVYYVGILNGQLVMSSPGKAVQTIQRAVRVAPAPMQAKPTMVAAGGGQQ